MRRNVKHVSNSRVREIVSECINKLIKENDDELQRVAAFLSGKSSNEFTNYTPKDREENFEGLRHPYNPSTEVERKKADEWRKKKEEERYNAWLMKILHQN